MRSTTVAMALMSSVVAAQSSVVTLFLFGFDQQQLDGSILGSDATATTYSIDCAPGTDPASCGLPPGGMTVVQGPKTVHVDLNYGGTANLYAEAGCQLNTAASEAVCSETQGGSAAPYPGTTSATFTGTDYNGFLFPVTITAGSASGAPASTAASATAPTVSATMTSAANSAAASTAASTASGMTTVKSPATTAASSTKVSTGGMPQITGNAQWAMGGVAVAVALAAL